MVERKRKIIKINRSDQRIETDARDSGGEKTRRIGKSDRGGGPLPIGAVSGGGGECPAGTSQRAVHNVSGSERHGGAGGEEDLLAAIEALKLDLSPAGTG